MLGRDTASTRIAGAGTWTLAGTPHDVTSNRNNYIGDHYFAIESAHDQEYGFEICYNELGGCISVPKTDGGPRTLPEGFSYAVRIHHNL